MENLIVSKYLNAPPVALYKQGHYSSVCIKYSYLIIKNQLKKLLYTINGCLIHHYNISKRKSRHCIWSWLKKLNFVKTWELCPFIISNHSNIRQSNGRTLSSKCIWTLISDFAKFKCDFFIGFAISRISDRAIVLN